ncbi:MAG: serpin family protein [Treponema sp.]|nr:serpin family protein [Treponema sp.]
MRKLKTFLFTILFTSTLLYANEPLPELTIAQDSINSFETKLYQTLSATKGNVNYSALSIYSLLYALQKGAQGTTKDQINQVIDLSPSQDADSQLKTIITGTENMTNSLWYKKTLTIQDDYKAFTQNYDFIIKPTDFYNGPKVRKDINSFISKQTDKLIENFLQEDLPVDTQLVLLNTLYFNQKWKTTFDKHDTREETFYKNNQSQTQVQMMHKTTSVPYYEDENFQIIELDYENKRYSMIVILPKDYEYDFTKADLFTQLQKFSDSKNYNRVQLSFPKFDLTSKYDLVPILQNLGMTDAFNPAQSDLSKIFADSQNIFVDSAIHQVRIQVNEKETKAAAVTKFGSKAASAMPERPPIIFKADHPFLYVIRDNELGINLFTGIVREPK